MSRDNFESCILSFLRATSTIHDDEEARINDWRNLGADTVCFDVVTTTEKQLVLPFGDPLAR